MDGDILLAERHLKDASAPHRAAVSVPPAPSVYSGTVVHKRLQPFQHKLEYSVFSVLLDLDTLSETAGRSRLLRYNRPGILSFYDKDHGPRDGSPLRPWVDRMLQAHGIPIEGGSVRLLCFPRLWGYVFNPLSVYYCYAADGALAAVLYEVSNTFGDWHGYLLRVDADEAAEPIRQSAEKVFHVSPFMPVDGRYQFTLRAPAERLLLTIRHQDKDGNDRMIARHSAKRSDLTARTLAQAVLRHPLMTVKVIAAIHWEALRLWLKGASYHAKPVPNTRKITQ